MKLIPAILGVLFVCLVVFGSRLIVKNRKTPEHLGVTNGEFSALPQTPNAVSTQARDVRRRVEPLDFHGDIEQSKSLLLNALREYGGVIIGSQGARYIHAVHQTRVFRFRDDLEFYFDVANRKIEFKSVSRVGYSDMGLNRSRFLAIKAIYDSHFSGEPKPVSLAD